MNKPTEPVREEYVRRSICLSEDATIKDLYKKYPDGIITFYYDYEGTTTKIVWTSPETDEEFNLRMKRYNKELAAYQKWVSSGAAEKEKQKELAALAKQKKALENKMKKLEKLIKDTQS